MSRLYRSVPAQALLLLLAWCCCAPGLLAQAQPTDRDPGTPPPARQAAPPPAADVDDRDVPSAPIRQAAPLAPRLSHEAERAFDRDQPGARPAAPALLAREVPLDDADNGRDRSRAHARPERLAPLRSLEEPEAGENGRGRSQPRARLAPAPASTLPTPARDGRSESPDGRQHR